jgi:hypothetical protein
MATRPWVRLVGLVAGAWLVAGCGAGPAGGGDAGLDAGTDAGFDAGLGAFQATGRMSAYRSGHTATLLPGGKVLVAGGSDPGGTLASAELFDPGASGGVGAFAPTGTMTTSRWAASAVLLPGGKVLLVGGRGASGNDAGAEVVLASAELFEAAGNGGAGAFTPTGSLQRGRYGATAVLLADGRALVVGGASFSGPELTAELYDPAAGDGGAFTATLSLGWGRGSATATRLADDRVLIAGGAMDAGTAELYVPASDGGVGTIIPTATLDIPRSSAVAALLPSGKVLIAGGISRYNWEASAELFDPAASGGAGAFSPAGDMAAPRVGATATVLGSGKVLLAGGDGFASGSPAYGLATAELFDPAASGGTGAFSPTGSLVTGRSGATATRLPSGKVLLTGGSANGVPLRSAELYVP